MKTVYLRQIDQDEWTGARSTDPTAIPFVMKEALRAAFKAGYDAGVENVLAKEVGIGRAPVDYEDELADYLAGL